MAKAEAKRIGLRASLDAKPLAEQLGQPKAKKAQSKKPA
jgi:hypothetical protein